MITKDHPLWPPVCEGELVDEGITHAHALLSANRELVNLNEGLREWITIDANLYDPDMVHVDTRSELEQPMFQIWESHFFTCYGLVYDEDGEHLGYDKSKTFSYELEVESDQTWQIMGNTREEINQYLLEHGFEVEEDHSGHSKHY